MKKRLVFLFLTFITLIFISSVSAIRINEVELNPSGTDAGNEWIELYSNSEINLNGYYLENGDGDKYELNTSFSDYLVINLNKQWLDNSNESVKLFKNNELIDETDIFNDAANNDKTYQYCDDEWIFKTSTKNKENNCEADGETEKTENKTNEKENKTTEDETDKETTNEKQKLVKENKTNILSENIEEDNEHTVIYLNKKTSENLKTPAILYESKTEKIKTYAIYGFGVLCILLIIALIFKRKK